MLNIPGLEIPRLSFPGADISNFEVDMLPLGSSLQREWEATYAARDHILFPKLSQILKDILANTPPQGETEKYL